MSGTRPDQPVFDLGALFRAIELRRVERDTSWSEVARAVGVASSTIRRFEHAGDAEADGVLALVRWLEIAPEEFVRGGHVEGVSLPHAAGGNVRVDVSLLAAVDRHFPGAPPGARTSIQRLTAVAQGADRPIASFTRLRDR